MSISSVKRSLVVVAWREGLHLRPASGLVRLANGDVGLVFEGGDTHRREWIRFYRLPLAWLTDGQDGRPG